MRDNLKDLFKLTINSLQPYSWLDNQEPRNGKRDPETETVAVFKCLQEKWK